MKKKIIFIILIFFILTVLAFLSIKTPIFKNPDFFFTKTYLVNSSSEEPKKLFLNSWKLIKKRYYDSTLNQQDWNRWKERYLNQIETEDDAYIAINSMLASLNDPYSIFLSPKEYFEQTTNIDSQLVGIGVSITSLAGKIIVISALEGTPAQKAGFVSGDVLLKVDDKDIQGKNISEVAQMIRGEEGTDVKILFLHDNKKIEKILRRETIEIKSVKNEILDEGIGYIRISSFLGSNVADDFLEAMAQLQMQNTKGLILDLRGNTGGLLPNAIVIADLFLTDGNIVSIVDRNGIRSDITVQEKKQYFNQPIVILVDGATASAAEILSGALKDKHKAVLVGEKTFGKGMVQKVYPMQNKTGLNLTIAKYLTPNGNDINKKGIVPDYIVKYTINDYYTDKDPQLDEAKRIMKKLYTTPISHI